MNNRYVQQFKKGSLEMILLSLIGRKETYGYEIITELNSSASVLGYAKEGTIYPILYRLQEAELIQCRLAPAAANGGSKKYYSLTLKGKEVLQELITFWSSYTDCVNRHLSTNGGLRMKEQYIRQVEKELNLSRKAKTEVVRDLNEIFNSAVEHGETEQQVIERLGTPQEFANSTAEQFGIDNSVPKKRKWIISSVISLVVAIVAFLIYATAKSGKVPEGAIGQADAMTNIQVNGDFIFDASQIILLVGIIAFVFATIQIIRAVHNNRR